MTRLRLVLITRQFWPSVGGAQTLMASLAQELQERGAEVTILTARWQAASPVEFRHRGVRVLRLSNPRTRFWGTVRYMHAVASWLRKHRRQYDLVYVSMLKHDAYAALGALDPRTIPVILRPEGSGESGDVCWQQTARCGRRIARRCRQATALVAVNDHVQQELLAAGYQSERIHKIANGVEIPPPRDETARASARNGLAAANAELSLPVDAPLAIYTGRIDPGKGLDDLVHAWPAVIEKYPEARLWIVGDGPARETLSREIDVLQIGGRIVLAGQFDCVGDFYQAADLFVLPSREEMMSMALLEAMAAGLSVLASDIPGNRSLITPGQQGVLVPVGDVDAISRAVLHILDDPQEAARLGTAAREHVGRQFSLARMAEEHLELFERLVAENS